MTFFYLPLQREGREHRVYKELLRMVPNLEERVMTGSEQDLIEVADLVSIITTIHLTNTVNLSFSFVKGQLEPGAMTPKLSKGIFWNGSRRKASLSIRPFIAIKK